MMRKLICLPFLLAVMVWAGANASAQTKLSIVEQGAVGDGTTLNTKAIQATIDKLAGEGGGTVVVPEGVFLSGALFLKPGVNLHLEKGSVIKCAPDTAVNFPAQRTRIEGHFEEAFNPALINADGCDGLQITGEGTLDGAGNPIWDEFWTRRNNAVDRANFRNLDVARARMALIENSKDVTVRGITFKDSQFWNLHLYNCQNILVEGAQFVVPDDYAKPPSTDGIDIDSCQGVTIKGCYFSVNDDCIAMKGTKGPFALEDKTSPPVVGIRISDCVFKRGHGVLTLGSEATIVRDVVVENSTVTGAMPLVRFKLRPDTPQHYEDIHYRNIKLESEGIRLFEVRKWSQYFDLMGQPEPKSTVRNITVTGLTGKMRSLGEVQGNAETVISDITLEDVDVTAQDAKFSLDKRAERIVFKNVKVNGETIELGKDE